MDHIYYLCMISPPDGNRVMFWGQKGPHLLLNMHDFASGPSSHYVSVVKKDHIFYLSCIIWLLQAGYSREKVGHGPSSRKAKKKPQKKDHKWPSYTTIMICNDTGSEIVRGSAEFRIFSRILVVPEISVNLVRNLKSCMGVGVSQELLSPQKWFTYQNLWNFTGECMKVFSGLCFYEKLLQIQEKCKL